MRSKRAPKHPHVARAQEYVRDVLSGAVPACRWVVKACERHQGDLERADSEEFPFYFDPDAAERFCVFAGLMRHVKGAKAGQPFVLEPWQCFVACSIFGWTNRLNGTRRFRRLYLELARKNGKSFYLAVIGLYMLAIDGEAGAECYSAATTREQAKIVFKTAQQIAKKVPSLLQSKGLEVLAHAIVQQASDSSFLALSAEDNSLDGLNPHFASIDELHAHKTRGVYDVIDTAMGARSQPLLAAITTAGSDRTGICYEVRSDLCKILDGTARDESFFGLVYTIDEEDDWRDESVWLKANPNLGVSVNLDYLRSMAEKAKRTPAAQAAFQTKHLDVWVGANAALYSIDDWMACADPQLSLDDFAGEECIAGIDLASKQDLADYCRIFEREGADGRPHYYVFGRHYLPQAALDEGRNAQYQGWASEGWLTVTPGETTNQARIEEDVLEDSSRFDLAEVCYDPWQATGLAQRLAGQGATVVEVRATVANFSEPTDTLGALMKDRRIHHNGDPVLAWAISNVVGHYDAKENVYPRKERPENKIDPAISLLMALGRWLRRDLARGESEYERRAREETEAPAAPEAVEAAVDPETAPAAEASRPTRRRSIYDSPDWLGG